MFERKIIYLLLIIIISIVFIIPVNIYAKNSDISSYAQITTNKNNNKTTTKNTNRTSNTQDVNNYIKNFNNIYHVKHDDVEGLKTVILNIYNKKVNEINNDLESSDYSRVLLTQKLANVLVGIER